VTLSNFVFETAIRVKSMYQSINQSINYFIMRLKVDQLPT